MSAVGKEKTWWDRWRIKVLAGLGAFALYMMYSNLFSGPSIPDADRPAAAGKGVAGGPISMVGAVPKKAGRSKAIARGRSDEFHPVYLNNRPELRPDPASIDPTMRLDLLAKVQAVDAAGGARNLFAFGSPPPPKASALPPHPEPVVNLAGAGRGATGPTGPTGPSAESLKINLKYYGIVAYTQGGKKTACFLDDADPQHEEILLGNEGDTLKRRYRVMKIGNGSVTMEDTESKREQTIPLTLEAKSL
jgi:hypothetical protein